MRRHFSYALSSQTGDACTWFKINDNTSCSFVDGVPSTHARDSKHVAFLVQTYCFRILSGGQTMAILCRRSLIMQTTACLMQFSFATVLMLSKAHKLGAFAALYLETFKSGSYDKAPMGAFAIIFACCILGRLFKRHKSSLSNNKILYRQKKQIKKKLKKGLVATSNKATIQAADVNIST